MTVVLLLGSAPSVVSCRQWPREPFDQIVAINNAWAVRPDWDYLIHPWDFAPDRLPPALELGQRIITENDFVPAQNAYGGFVYAGATMAFTAAYWALHALRPTTIAFFGCDMMYDASGQTHFYGTGTPDPLRSDITLQSLEAKSARLRILAARQGCAVVNLSDGRSRLALPRAGRCDLPTSPESYDKDLAALADRQEGALGYFSPSGRYWEELDRYDPSALVALDALWLRAGVHPSTVA